METVKGYHQNGALAVEFISLPDGKQVTKNYDETGIHTIEEKYYRKDGTLQMRRQYDEKGHWVTIKYDEIGKNPIKDTQSTDEIRELVESAELLSKKGSKRRQLLTQKQRG